jgi:hypothetical protein
MKLTVRQILRVVRDEIDAQAPRIELTFLSSEVTPGVLRKAAESIREDGYIVNVCDTPCGIVGTACIIRRRGITGQMNLAEMTAWLKGRRR